MCGNHGAKAKIEIALCDLAGKAARKPVRALLGEKKRNRLPLLGVVNGDDIVGGLRDAEQEKAGRIAAYKTKVGIDTPEDHAARPLTICATLGPGLLISADANQGYTADEALRYVHAVKGCGLNFSSSRWRRATLPTWQRCWRKPAISAPTRVSIRSTTSGGTTEGGPHAVSA